MKKLDVTIETVRDLKTVIGKEPPVPGQVAVCCTTVSAKQVKAK